MDLSDLIVGTSPCKFTKTEVSNEVTSLSREQAENIIKFANRDRENLNKNSFLRYELTDYKKPTKNNKTVKELLSTKIREEFQGTRLEIGEYKIWKLTEGLYKVDKKPLKEPVPLSHYVSLARQNKTIDRFDNGVAFMEKFFSSLRKSTKKNPEIFYYASTTSNISIDGSSETLGFQIDNLPTPAAKVFGEIPGATVGAISYLATLGAPFPNHLDDGELNACNVVLYGGSKVWIVAHKDKKETLRKAICSLLRTIESHVAKCRAHHKDLILDPEVYRHLQIPFQVVEQRVGDVMFIGRSTWHQGQNFSPSYGLTIATASNVLLKEYRDEYQDAKENGGIISCKHLKDPVFFSAPDWREIDKRMESLTLSDFEDESDNDDNNDDQTTEDEGFPEMAQTEDSSTDSESSIEYDTDNEAKLGKAQLLQICGKRRRKIKALKKKLMLVKTQQKRKRQDTVSDSGSEDDEAVEAGVRVVGAKQPENIQLNGKTCPECLKVFINNYNMRKHYALHFEDGIGRFQCKTCKKSFSYKENMERHIKSKHQGVRYNCHVQNCTKSYAYIHKLKEHVQKKHM